MADPTIVLLLALLALVGVVSLVLALRHPLSFRIAMRNVRRGRWRSVLLVAGLLVGTTIISGSLAVGDTVTNVDLHFVYLAVGTVYESVSGSAPSGGSLYFPTSVYSQLAANTSSDPRISGLTPMIIDTTQVLDRTTGIPETDLNLIATDAGSSTALGSFVSTSGPTLPGPSGSGVYLDSVTAQAMNASVGDRITLYGAVPVNGTIAAIVEENVRGAFLTGGITPGNVFVDLATAQELQGEPGKINFIAVTNSGPSTTALAHSHAVSAALNQSLARIPEAAGLSVGQPLYDAVTAYQVSGQNTETIFLVLGLFSIVAGLMLIIGIFLMLAEERKGEMGMLRAIGLQRRHLILAFYFEGLAYSAGSALAGTFLGVAVGYGLAYAFSIIYASSGVISSAILSSFTVSNVSLVLSYCLGFLLTLATVAAASYRASRLNIVRAIRDIPEPPPARRVYSYLAAIGGLMLVLGLLIFLPSYRGTGDLSVPVIGGGLALLGLGLIASRFLVNRIAFTVSGAALIVWAGFEPLHTALLGSAHSGGIFIIFVDGILMIFGALLIYIFNAPVLVGLLLRATAGRTGRNPVSRIAFSYPARQPTRTSITLTIFALVIFTMVAIACTGATVAASLNRTVSDQTGGYSFFGVSPRPIPDLPGQIAANATLNRSFATVVPMITGSVNVNASGFGPNPYSDAIYSGPTNTSPSSSFYATSQFPFAATFAGLTPAEVLHELATNPSDAIVDNTYDPTPSALNSGPSSPHPLVAPGGQLELTAPGSSRHVNVTVIGVLKENLLTGVFLNPVTANALGYHRENLYLLTVRPGVATTLAAQQAKQAFFPYGLVLYDLKGLLATSIDNTLAVIGLLEIFVALGLAVGIAAMGILALRAVVERRHEIGMLRAQGFTQGMVLRAFFLEYSFVTLLGILVGTVLGVLIVYNLTTSPSAATSGVSTFAVPVASILGILALAYGLAMLAIAGPSIRASRLPPADALRSTE